MCSYTRHYVVCSVSFLTPTSPGDRCLMAEYDNIYARLRTCSQMTYLQQQPPTACSHSQPHLPVQLYSHCVDLLTHGIHPPQDRGMTSLGHCNSNYHRSSWSRSRGSPCHVDSNCCSQPGLVIASPAESSSSSSSSAAPRTTAHPGDGSSSTYSSISSNTPGPGVVRSWSEIFRSAGAQALGGGLPGSAAMVVQVLSLMWLRTTVNYQYRFGTSTSTALRTLYQQGGIPRFYQGLAPALLQGPLCRFGDTAANAGVLSVLDELDQTRNLPVGVKTAAASAAAGAWRMLLLPIDATKTMMQVEGRAGLKHLYSKVVHHGPGVLYHGAFASVGATFVGHYPWFTTYNYLNQLIPKPEEMHLKLLRSAGIGFCAGVVSDVVSNSVRVVKTTRQTARRAMSYKEVVRSIVAQDGVSGLFTRGLTTRIAANGLQNICFTVLWQLGQDRLKQSGFVKRLEGR